MAWPDAGRQAAFERWLTRIAPQHGLQPETLRPASADASFRRYLRLQGQAGSLIVMDAPPPQEDVRPFVHVAGLLQTAGLHAPRVLACETGEGFLLLTDLGDRLLLGALQSAPPQQADAWMRQALDALLTWQQRVPAGALPAWASETIRAELALFPTWCVQREFGQQWDARQQQAWSAVVEVLVANILAQPQVAVHSDWMPRNLMLGVPSSGAEGEVNASGAPGLAGVDAAGRPGIGILDFQDAVCGPITYDLASLLRDAFISWPEEQQLDWAVRWWQQARRAGLPVDADFGEFWRSLEWTGLQRHLRILGVFCRLKHRDGKPAYAQELPRFFHYATQVALRYQPLKPLLRLLEPLSGARVAAGWTF